MHRNVFTIFIASPNDLSAEREKTKEAIDRFCRVLGRKLNWHIELLGWEDTLPGYARPQSLINKDVDSCDLFIGILWKRWGTATGKYESGFEEEFELARERRRTTGKPEIWLFFKSIGKEFLKDPGEQLKRVLRFKKEQIENKELLFKEFDEKSWSDLIYDCITEYVLGLSEQLASVEQSITAKRAREATTLQHHDEKQEEILPEEIISLYHNISSEIKANGNISLQASETLRLLLQSTSLFSSQNSWFLLGTHEINSVYLHRKNWELSIDERYLLIRTFIGDKYNLRPGWFWLSYLAGSEVIDFLRKVVIGDSEVTIRQQASNLLSELRFDAPRDLLESGLSDDDDTVVSNTIKILMNTGNIENLNLLDPIIEDIESNAYKEALKARIELLYLKEPESAFLELISTGADIPPAISNTLEHINLKVSIETLLKALHEGSSSLRRFASQYLRKTKQIHTELAYTILNDTDPLVRKEALLTLIEHDEKVDIAFVRKVLSEPSEITISWEGDSTNSTDVDYFEFIPLILSKVNPKELLASIDFYTVEARESYSRLASEYFNVIESRIRSDLDSDFESLKSESESRMRQKYGTEANSLLAEYNQDLVDFMKSQLISAALKGLSLHGVQSDIKFARKYLGKTKYNLGAHSAITIISKFGDESDIERLILFAAKTNQNLKELSVKTALDLSNDKKGLFKSLLKLKGTQAANIAVRYLVNFEQEEKIAIARELLFSETDDIRLTSLALLVQELNDEALESLLDEYVVGGQYYYNVVSWLDKCIYAPNPFVELFKAQLTDHLKLSKS